MSIRRICALAAVVVGNALLSSCTSSDIKGRFTGRWGPDPALPAADAESVIANQTRILGYIVLDAGIAPPLKRIPNTQAWSTGSIADRKSAQLKAASTTRSDRNIGLGWRSSGGTVWT